MLETKYCDPELNYPMIASPTGTTMNYDRCKRAEDAGFSVIVLKSVQEEQILHDNPNPRFEVNSPRNPGLYC